MKSIIRRSRQSGDTIVEVLIAVAVVSSVLVGAFLVTQQSNVSVRNGQEHSEMLQVLQGQVERVRSIALAQTSPTGGIFTPGKFCVADVGGSYIRVNATTEGEADGGGAATECKNLQGRYEVNISYNDTTNIFTFEGSWDTLHGNRGQEALHYRVYSGAPIAVTTTGAPAAAGGGGGGESIIEDSGNCGKPGQPSCSGDISGGRYSYQMSMYNRSVNPPGTVAGCTYNWGDGKPLVRLPANHAWCTYGGHAVYTYDRPDPELQWPLGCALNPAKKITLTMHLTDGSDIVSETQYAKMAYCGPGA